MKKRTLYKTTNPQKHRLWGNLACAIFFVFLFTAHLFGVPETGYTDIASWKYRSFLTGSSVMPLLLFFRAIDLRLDGQKTPLLFRKRELPYLLYLLFTVLSALLSAFSGVWLGNTRQEGVLTVFCCVCTALLLGRHFVPKGWMLGLAGGSVCLFCLFGGIQFFGKNPLSLYPLGYTYYDGDRFYFGKYWSTVGNTGLCVALLTMAAGCFSVYLIRGSIHRPLAAIPLFLSVFSIAELSGDAGLLALAVGIPLLLPFCVRSSLELAHATEMAAVLSGALGLSRALTFTGAPKYSACILPLSAAGGFFVLALLLRKRPLKLSAAALRRILLVTVVLLFIAAPITLYFADGVSSGFLWEAQQLLHGNWDDDFGSGRLYIWRNVWGLVKEAPLFGGGPDTLGLRGLAWKPTYFETLQTTVVTKIDAAHNELLHILVNQGAFALLAYLAIVGQALYRWVAVRDDLCGLVCGGAVLFYFLQSMFSISSSITAPYFWMALGCLLTESEDRQG